MTDSTLNIEISEDKAIKDLGKLDRALDSTTRKGDKTAKSVDKIGKDATKSAKGLGFLKTALIGAFSFAALKGIINTISTFESLQNSLGVVFQSMERGREVFKDIQEIAAITPFGVDALTESVIKLRASGIEPTTAQLTLFSDVASVTGDAVGSLQAITDLFARTTSGGLGLIDLNRLGDKGIPVFTILAERLGLSRLEVGKLGKSAEGSALILDELTKGLEERFGGASVDAANLLQTSISNLGDEWDRFLQTIGDTGFLALTTTVVQGLTSAIEFLGNNLGTVAVALTGIATLALPAVITGIKALTVAIAANPIGLLVVGITAAITALFHFRGVIFDTLIKVWEVNVPNAIDHTLIAFQKVKRGIFEVVNSVLTGISNLANSLISNTPNWLKAWLGIDGEEVDFGISTTKLDAAITEIENRVRDRIANFQPPPRPDFLGIDDEEETSTGGGLLESESLTGEKLFELKKQGIDKVAAAQLEADAKALQSLELSLLTEEGRLVDSYQNRLDIVVNALESELITEQRADDILMTVHTQFQDDLLALEKKGGTEREKFAKLSLKKQTTTVLGELLNMTAGVAQHNKTLFNINKSAGIATAIVNTWEGVSETLSKYPQPLASILAAGHLAAGLATVDAIRSTSFEGGGGGTIPSAATGGGPAPNSDIIQPLELDSDGEQERGQINITMIGEFTSDGFRLAVVQAIDDATENDEVIITNVAN